LHKAGDAPRLSSLQSFIDAGQLQICGRLSDRAVAREYRSHGIVWVHSLREGFGRWLVEGRLAGAHVICSDIPEFEDLRDDAVYVYKDVDQFMATLDRVVQLNAPTAPYNGYRYRELLRSGIEHGFREVADFRAAAQVRPAG
jgi:hypothetical protein